MILVGGFFDNNIEGFREAFIHSQTGHLQVNVAGYYEKGVRDPFRYLLKNVSHIQGEIESQRDVSLTVPRLKFSGILSSEKSSIAVVALGVDPMKETRMGTSYIISNSKNPSVKIVAGEDLDPSDPDGVILGQGLLKALNLKVGDSVSFITTREWGSIDGAEFHVRGVFETIMKDFDDRVMKVNLPVAQKILDVPNQVHSLLVILRDTLQTDRTQEILESQFRHENLNLEVVSWERQGRYYFQSKALLSKIYGVIQLIICVIFFLSIANTFNMVILERMREFGTMMALGNGRGTIFAVIVLECLCLGLVGSVLGILVGSGVAEVVSSIGIQMPPPPQGTSPYVAMVTLSPGLLFQTFLISLLSCGLASLMPGYRASHFRIIEALKFV
jgi:putative ABC transport system permease protein